MEKTETAEAIEIKAARWVARLDRAGDDPVARADVGHALEAWLGDDVRRRGAYFRAASAWAMLDRASILGRAASGAKDDAFSGGDSSWQEWDDDQFDDEYRRYDQMQVSEVVRPSISRRAAFRWGGGALAASLVAGVTGSAVLGPGTKRDNTGGEVIATRIGEIRRVPLVDGSLASVNTQSQIIVEYKPKERKVALAKGEAWFRVAKNPDRPFVVEAGDVRARAVGTAFSVRKTDEGVTVQVTEGRVAVWRVGDEDNVDYVDAGSRAFVAAVLPQTKISEDPPAINRSLAWRQGELAFDGDTLGEAAQEFNRYNRVQIRIDDPALASEKLVGRFRTDEPDAFARAASTTLDADVQFVGGEIRLYRR
ncbi:FecR family protein [Sphingorhabdus contaminans]|uniref:DUF4974 domain-containing protein n=1 Tax=Sphingorhabdus contaminans TaxID=1343899 RepID=A0A553WA79_9SPHN|nr:FecR domain-containing protein [Sphingorhabdus contaminans]TSB01589.1 DUF4974 domain-containing protein [Sphingorhabdus contaminans]